jgi:hypothetical protein
MHINRKINQRFTSWKRKISKNEQIHRDIRGRRSAGIFTHISTDRYGQFFNGKYSVFLTELLTMKRRINVENQCRRNNQQQTIIARDNIQPQLPTRPLRTTRATY